MDAISDLGPAVLELVTVFGAMLFVAVRFRNRPVSSLLPLQLILLVALGLTITGVLIWDRVGLVEAVVGLGTLVLALHLSAGARKTIK